MKASRPTATIVIVAITAVAYCLVAALDAQSRAIVGGAFIPARASGLFVPGALPFFLTPLSAALLHAGPLHLGFNLLTLYFCGREDEVALGRVSIAILYVVGAYAAAALQYAVGPHSMVPMVGASGAISALVGAYGILYGKRRASNLPPELARWLHVAWLAAAWVGLQLLLGFASHSAGMAIAIAAHIGGFLAGVLLARPLLRWRYRKA
jgi:membrane associated rhomboid family serine protease